MTGHEAVDGDELSTRRPEHPERDLWFVPTVSKTEARNAECLFQQYDIDTVYDLGAGDCRFALWCAKRGYEAVAYELHPELVSAVRDHYDIDGFDIRERDYYSDFESIVREDAAVVAFGGTNELPTVPDVGLALEGYFETGIKAYYAGELVDQF